MEKEILQELSNHFSVSENEFTNLLLKNFLEVHLQKTNLKLSFLQSKYNILTISEFENLYRTGKIPEEGTWEDYQDFDHYEFIKDKFENFLEKLNKIKKLIK